MSPQASSSAPVPRSVIDAVRFLSADAVEKAKSGHPGTPLGAAELAATLWGQVLRFDPADPQWRDRDRFVLSVGHASMLLYSLLHLFGYDLKLEEIKDFRQLGSRTAGHPEYGLLPGVEVTTGPLGQGVANAVGFALGQAMLAARFNGPAFSPVQGRVYCLAGDGCLMEGVAYEAASLAGHLGLGNLCLLYDSNRISIEGSTDIAFTEDVGRRFESMGWAVHRVSAYEQPAILAALAAARAQSAKPSLIICESLIGLGAGAKQGSAKSHGEPLGSEALQAAKAAAAWPLEPAFHVPEEAYAWCRARVAEKQAERRTYEAGLAAWKAAQPALAEAWERHWTQALPADLAERVLAKMDLKAAATRVYSGQAINILAAELPCLIGGSADLAGSNNSEIQGGGHVGVAGPAGMAKSLKGRVLHFGVREHAMGAVVNALNLHGAWRAFGATFLQFADYMRPAVRLAALMQARSLFVFTHDSIFLGEDGPTHQPVEHLAALRLIPRLAVWRPADGLETALAWTWALAQAAGPSALCLSRQKLEPLERPAGFQPRQVWRGGYVLQEDPAARATLLATGSEVGTAVQAARLLKAEGLALRIVSLPCLSLFEAQDKAYRQQVLGGLPLASLEAGTSGPWRGLVGPAGLALGVDSFGESAPAEKLAEHFGISPAKVAAQLRAWLQA